MEHTTLPGEVNSWQEVMVVGRNFYLFFRLHYLTRDASKMVRMGLGGLLDPPSK